MDNDSSNVEADSSAQIDTMKKKCKERNNFFLRDPGKIYLHYMIIKKFCNFFTKRKKERKNE